MVKRANIFLDFDFYVDPRPITKEDEKAFSNYIKADKLKHAKKNRRKAATHKAHLQTVQQTV